MLATSALNNMSAARLTINCEGQKADECGGIVVNRTNPRVFLDNLEFRYLFSTMFFVCRLLVSMYFLLHSIFCLPCKTNTHLAIENLSLTCWKLCVLNTLAI